MNPFHSAAEWLHRLAGPTAPEWLQGVAIIGGLYAVLAGMFALAALMATVSSRRKA